MKRMVVVVALWVPILSYAERFKVTVIHPDGEEKVYRIDSKSTTIKMGKSKWTCDLDIDEPKNQKGFTLYGSHLQCLALKYTAGISSSCTTGSYKTISALHLSEGDYKTYYRIGVECDPN